MALAASLVPGVNAWLAGRRGLAGIVAIGCLGGLGLAWFIVHLSGGILHTLVSPTALGGLGAINLAILGLRLQELRLVRRDHGSHVLQAPSHRLRQRERVRVRRLQRVALALILPVIALPHLMVTSQLEVVRRTIVETFDSRGGFDQAGTFDHAAVAAEPQVPEPHPTVSDGVDQQPVTEPSQPTPAGLQSTDGSIDILLIGLDSGAGRVGARNDANLVVSIDPQTAEVTLIGVPRNLVQIPFPRSAEACRCYSSPLYSLYGYGNANAQDFPSFDDPGAEAVTEAVAALIGRQIDWYVVADLAAFRHVVDAVGGIDVDVSEPVQASFTDPEDLSARIGVDVDPGRHHLDGSAALAYARARADSDDYRRMARQRCLIAGASGSAQDVSPADAARLVATTRGQLSSSIPREALAPLVDVVHQVDAEDIASIALVPPEYAAGWASGYPIPDVERIREAVGNASGSGVAVTTTSEC